MRKENVVMKKVYSLWNTAQVLKDYVNYGARDEVADQLRKEIKQLYHDVDVILTTAYDLEALNDEQYESAMRMNEKEAA
ncbi:MAG: hypothetical protein IIZ95_01095 [Erysipelotrichaceae bacterium]|nr:hypothetical protein [Erysipelotrichaceae bacterium]